MRSEKEMFDLIINTAKKDNRIRAVYMGGSRANKNCKKDIFQDYDIVYVVEENKPFYKDKNWIDIFGEQLYMQCPELVDYYNGINVNFDKSYRWLIQFKDGNRLDLHIVPVNEINISNEKFFIVLLDKDNLFAEKSKTLDKNYWIKKPNQNEFYACCNEFWWCLNNVAKGLWREEIPYVHKALYEGSHPQLVKLLNWKIGYETNFQTSTGKASKYLKDYLSQDIWNRFLKTYINGNINDIWKSIFIMCDLFNEIALELSKNHGYIYDLDEANASYNFLKHVQKLPKNAKSIF